MRPTIGVQTSFAEFVEKAVDVGCSEEDSPSDADAEHAWLLSSVALRVQGARREAQVLGGFLERQ